MKKVYTQAEQEEFDQTIVAAKLSGELMTVNIPVSFEEYEDLLDSVVRSYGYRFPNLSITGRDLISRVEIYEAFKNAMIKGVKEALDEQDLAITEFVDYDFVIPHISKEIKEAGEVTRRKREEAAAKRKATMEAKKAAANAKALATKNQATIIIPIEKKAKAEEALRKLGLLS